MIQDLLITIIKYVEEMQLVDQSYSTIAQLKYKS